MARYKVKVPHETIDTNLVTWLRENVGKSDVDWTITFDLVEAPGSESDLVAYVHFDRQEDATKFILTWC